MQEKTLPAKKKPGKTGLDKSLWKMGSGKKAFLQKSFFPSPK